jgi:hypothetical protein
MTDERIARLMQAVERGRAVLRSFGAEPPPPDVPAEAPLSVVLLCRGGRLGRIASAAGSRVDVLCALSTPVALEFLATGRFDALVIDAASLGLEARIALEDARRMPILTDVPVVVVASPFDGPIYGELGATAVVTLDGLEPAILAHGAVFKAVRTLKADLRDIRSVVVQPGESGLSGRALLAAHLERVLASGERDVSLGVMALSLASGAPVPTRIVRAAADLVRSVTRSEDTVAELRPATFGLILPGATGAEAERVARRLSGIVESSAVLDADGANPVQPVVDRAIVTLSPGLSLDAVWAALRQGLARSEAERSEAADAN